MAAPFARVRRHHAIEHATVAVLFERRGRQVSVVGRSDGVGFHLVGPFSKDEVESAAQEALRRLGEGQSHLAVTNLCGTNLAATGFLTASAALLAAGRDRRNGWAPAVTAATVAAVAAQPLGRWIQRKVTTDAATNGIRLDRVEERGTGPRKRFRVYLSGA